MRYLTSSEFAVRVTENWQSEYLQFLLFIFATVWLLVRISRIQTTGHCWEGVRQGPDGRQARRQGLPGWAKVGGF